MKPKVSLSSQDRHWSSSWTRWIHTLTPCYYYSPTIFRSSKCSLLFWFFLFFHSNYGL